MIGADTSSLTVTCAAGLDRVADGASVVELTGFFHILLVSNGMVPVLFNGLLSLLILLISVVLDTATS